MNALNYCRFAPACFDGRTSAIVGVVVLIHVGGLWALQSGLLQRVEAESIIPAEVLMDMNTTDAAPVPTAQPAAKLPLPPLPLLPAPSFAPPKSQIPPPAHAPPTAPVPLAVAGTSTPPDNPTLSPAPVATTTAANTSTTSPPTGDGTAVVANRAPALELPSSDADHLNNPTPAYPPLSKRLGEQGKVVIRTFIGVDGNAQQAQIKLSSGFDRLDQAALATALKWRYAPGKRAGVAEAMWFVLPFHWVLR